MSSQKDPVEMGLLIFFWCWGGWLIACVEAGSQALENAHNDHRHLHGRIAPHR